MKTVTATLILGLIISLSTGLDASAKKKTRAQCEPRCSSKLETCATKTANNGCIGSAQGCLTAGRAKCKSGGTGFDAPYHKCINSCMQEEQ